MGFLMMGAALASMPDSKLLDQGWRFRMVPGSSAASAHPALLQWQKAKVPGSVQMDLLNEKAIPNPYWRDNEAKLQWIGLTDWEYQLPLTVDKTTLQKQHIELVFAGLDTFADVSLNGHHLLAADNMFRRWRVPVKQWLYAGHNTLTVTLHSPIKQVQPWLLKQPYALPGEFDSPFGDEPKGKQTSNYVRKAAYQYGWDWGPRYVTEGIWKPVRLESWSDQQLQDFQVQQRHVDAQAAELVGEFAIDADHASHAHLSVSWKAPDGSTGQTSSDVTLKAGDNQLQVPVHIDHPQRWWPVGYGKPNMYTLHAEVTVDHKVVAQASRETGLRSVELRRVKDQWGRSFSFVVNGVSIFAKGANLIPFDSFPSRVTDAQMHQVLQSAVDANMNMLRVWGGGTYPSDRFYQMADHMGLMIWQDFMFGGAITPYDKAFRDNVRQEAIEQVRRLSNHPSLVLWCGNNEVETGWDSWDDRLKFRKSIGAAEADRIEKGMRELFGHTLRQVVVAEDADVPYWASTPSTDFDGPANVPTDGDMHYWDVWSGAAKPMQAYLDNTPRFQSEYGLQSMPVMSTIRAFALPGDMSVNSPVMRAHQKYDNGNGNDRLMLYIRRGFGEPKDFAAFVYLSQVMQAEGIALAVDHLRSSRPRTMGSLYWQLNDVWPGASWSSIDYFGRWKALQFHAKRFYAPVRVAPIRQNGKTKVSLISDRTQPIDAQLRTRVMDMDGKTLSDHSQQVKLKALASTQVADVSDAELLHGADPHRTFAVYELLDHGKLLSRHLLYFDRAEALNLPDPGLRAQLIQNKDGIELTVSATKLAREVWIDFGDLSAKLSDNAFDMLPGQSRTIHITSKAGVQALRKQLQLRSLFGATQPSHH